jgi:hypothetical protein
MRQSIASRANGLYQHARFPISRLSPDVVLPRGTLMLNGEVMRTQEDEYRASNRQITNLIDPFVALRGHPQQQELFDCGAQRQLLWNQDETWLACR